MRLVAENRATVILSPPSSLQSHNGTRNWSNPFADHLTHNLWRKLAKPLDLGEPKIGSL